MIKILFDTETTGLLKPSANDLAVQPYIVEIFCVKIDDDFNIIDEYETFIKPPIPMPKEASNVNGITQEMLNDALSFPHIWKNLAAFFTGVDMMIAHNLSYDRDMIANELRRIDRLLNFPWPIEHLCTVENTMSIRGHRMNLGQLHKHATGHFPEKAHRAKDDVYALVRCYHWMVENNYA